MIQDQYNQLIYQEQDIIDLFLTNPDWKLPVLTDTNLYYQIVDYDNRFTIHTPTDIQLNEFDKQQQSQWKMPDYYYNLDIADWVLKQCQSEPALQRCAEELFIYQEHDLFNLLRYIKYLVDTLRQNNIIWGVGRGSSVASYVLYKIGLHRINSLEYNLDFSEFLTTKEETLK